MQVKDHLRVFDTGRYWFAMSHSTERVAEYICTDDLDPTFPTGKVEDVSYFILVSNHDNRNPWI